MWTIRCPTNVFFGFGLILLATPCLAVLTFDPSCKKYRRSIDEAFADVQVVTDKAYKRLLAIKTGDTKAAATYMVFFGKDGDPEVTIGRCSSKKTVSTSVRLIACLDETR